MTVCMKERDWCCTSESQRGGKCRGRRLGDVSRAVNILKQTFSRKKPSRNAYNVFPLYVGKLCDLECCQAIKNNTLSVEAMNKEWNITAKEAEVIATKYGKKLVNSLTRLSDNYWFLVTSLDIFIHNNPKIDDCADFSKISYQNTPVS